MCISLYICTKLSFVELYIFYRIHSTQQQQPRHRLLLYYQVYTLKPAHIDKVENAIGAIFLVCTSYNKVLKITVSDHIKHFNLQKWENFLSVLDLLSEILGHMGTSDMSLHSDSQRMKVH